jgi:hypothetical protein
MSEAKEAPKAASVTPIGAKPNGAAAKPAPPKTAGQRLDDLERAMMSLFQNMDNLGRETGTIKEALRLLGNKVDALAKANLRGEAPTDETLSQIMIDNNVEELKGKVEGLVKAQVLVATDIVGDTSFIVGREIAADSDKVINPRLQFSLTALAKEVGDKIRGHLVGDIITIQEGQVRFEVLEVYNIQTPPPAAQPTAPATDAQAAAPAAAPATDASSTPAATATTDASAPAAPAAATPAAQDQTQTQAAPTGN